jgi:hypothetical protein
MNAQHQEIKSTIQTFFKGLHQGDTTIINKTIHKNLSLQTIFVNNEGKSNLKTETKKQFLKAIAEKKPTDIWLEELQSYTINIDGNLASVWTSYKFYFNNNFSHCGVNSFQLFNNNGHWEIISIVDTRRKENCNPINN